MALPRVTMECVVVRDVDLRFAQSGKAWATVRVVAKNSKRGPDGGWVDGEKCFIDVKMFERQAENLTESVTVGDTLLVNGVLELEEWETDGGEKRSKHVVVIDSFGSIGPSVRWNPWSKKQADRETARQDERTPANDPWASQAPVADPPF
jgi:single stranded DNA-binding protein